MSDDDFVRITLRLPKDLHGRLTEAAARKRSMNAEIIARLEQTFDASQQTVDHVPEVARIEAAARSIAENIEILLAAGIAPTLPADISKHDRLIADASRGNPSPARRALIERMKQQSAEMRAAAAAKQTGEPDAPPPKARPKRRS